AGLPLPGSALVEGDWTPASGSAGFARLCAAYPEMDAVFAANDQMALGAMQAAWQQGVNVPGELGVAGMDDISESAFFMPPLTTVRQNFHQLGDLAVRKLLRLAGMAVVDDVVADDTIIIQPELIVRRSTNRNGE
ncbi:MAG TPA: substrate-binding domain-containing protein, partial [Pseudodesulfovibrio sp.]|nr:substrate-binding domain-containing protein [Pseudodesulfovibrio sp.]